VRHASSRHRRVDPIYPEEARKAKLEGRVVVRVTVGADGKPHNIHVIQPFGSGFDEQAVAAVQQWEFQPAIKDGRRVAVYINVEVNFRLSPGPTPPTDQADPQNAALRAVFESLAERLVKRDFDGAYKFLSEQTAKQVSANRLASAFKMLEAENGELQSINFVGISRNSKPEPGNASVLAVVAARHHYESKEIPFTYLFRQEKKEWRLVAFKPGNQLPGGVVH
jgi:TonB family protein